jgi:mRNA-degrading endonuclease RelE of RelBE toxin-antitoxin system
LIYHELMWKVFEEKPVTKCIKKIPKDILFKYKAWIEVVKNGGPGNLKNYPGFKDEKLKGNLGYCRSPRFDIKYRVVYTESNEVNKIIVLAVTPHKYDEV